MSPTELELHYRRRKIVRRRLHRAYILQNVHVALVAMLFLVTSAAFWINPDVTTSNLGVQHPYDYFWNAFYLVGSLSVLAGLVTRRVGVEVPGHILLAPGMLVHMVMAITSQAPGTGRTAFLLILFMVGSVFRSYGLYAGWRETGNA